MGYHISVLQKGVQYEVEGTRIEFIQKMDGIYYFYLCKKDEWGFDYKRTDLIVSYTSKDIEFIKRIQSEPPKGLLKRIGKDKVFNRW
jgi:hypothetical protein